MNEWYFSQPVIDYRLLADAIDFYTERDYQYLETPWIVDFPCTAATKPPGSRDFYCLDGNLVASGEQSLLSAIRSGELEIGHKYQTLTPCFRDDPIDELHQTWFMKLELMWYSPTLHGDSAADKVDRVVCDAEDFMSRHQAVRRVAGEAVSEHQIDLESAQGIELGSYGFRQWHLDCWVYGTGLALPRFTIAQRKA